MTNAERTVPTRQATTSASTALSGGQNFTRRTNTPAPTHYEGSETTFPSQSPSLNPLRQGSGFSGESQSQFRRPAHPPPPLRHTSSGQSVSTDFGDLDLGRLPGYGFPPGGALVLDWPESTPTTQDSGSVGFGAFYEPQGELYTQLQSQLPSPIDFVSPTPIPARSNSTISEPAVSLGESRRSSGMIATARASVSIEMSGRGQSAPGTITTRAGQKRKADAKTVDRRESAASVASDKRPSVSRPGGSQADLMSPRLTRSQRQPQESDNEEDEEEELQDSGTAQAEQMPVPPKLKQSDSSEARRIVEVAPHLTTVLPAGKVFPIQIGSELFRLSGASLSSDAPSYFSHYFGEQLIQTGGRASQVKTLYIDRDPDTFKDIALHLQGYYVKPRDEEHFVRLFADAQFYSLPRLTQQLFKSEIFIQVGDRHFQIPRDIFSSPGDSPNFFSLGFAHFFSTPSEVFPGLDRQTLLRPPSILPPSVANRSGDVFADLLRILQGYDVKIRDADHRAELLRDARYFHLKGVEQKLLPCEVSQNVLRGRSEIVLRLEDIRQSGVGFLAEGRPGMSRTVSSGDKSDESRSGTSESENLTPTGWITYQRPYVDDKAHDLILEISSSEATRLDLASMRAAFSGQVNARVASLFSVIANKLNLPAMVPLGLMMMQSGGGIAAQPASPANSGVSGDKVRIRIDRDAYVTLDGDTVEWDDDEDSSDEGENSDENMTDGSVAAAVPKVRRWKRERALNKEMEWLVQRGQWRLRVEAAEDPEGSPSRVEVVLCAIRLEGYTREMHRNRTRGFLT